MVRVKDHSDFNGQDKIEAQWIDDNELFECDINQQQQDEVREQHYRKLFKEISKI